MPYGTDYKGRPQVLLELVKSDANIVFDDNFAQLAYYRVRSQILAADAWNLYRNASEFFRRTFVRTV
ncbi:MAG TPA: hypothetical protein VLA11_09090 [Woeseiaceae bacterium]|nr:hypothetical protein [Woeseiaceae bacterium]